MHEKSANVNFVAIKSFETNAASSSQTVFTTSSPRTRTMRWRTEFWWITIVWTERNSKLVAIQSTFLTLSRRASGTKREEPFPPTSFQWTSGANHAALPTAQFSSFAIPTPD